MRLVLALAVIAAIFVLSPARDGAGPAALLGQAVEAARAALPLPAGLGTAAAIAAGSLGDGRRRAEPPIPDGTIGPVARHRPASRL